MRPSGATVTSGSLRHVAQRTRRRRRSAAGRGWPPAGHRSGGRVGRPLEWGPERDTGRSPKPVRRVAAGRPFPARCGSAGRSTRLARGGSSRTGTVLGERPCRVLPADRLAALRAGPARCGLAARAWSWREHAESATCARAAVQRLRVTSSSRCRDAEVAHAVLDTSRRTAASSPFACRVVAASGGWCRLRRREAVAAACHLRRAGEPCAPCSAAAQDGSRAVERCDGCLHARCRRALGRAFARSSGHRAGRGGRSRLDGLRAGSLPRGAARRGTTRRWRRRGPDRHASRVRRRPAAPGVVRIVAVCDGAASAGRPSSAASAGSRGCPDRAARGAGPVSSLRGPRSRLRAGLVVRTSASTAPAMRSREVLLD